ncbi:MAG: hypothetical protein QMD11_11995 [Smithella sp.]|nr:hypothetical protein [Smithella sp.]
MKRLALITVLLLLTATVGPAMEKKGMTPKDQIVSAAAYSLPKDWKESFSLNQGDPQATLTYDLHKITVRLAGGEGSRYKKAPDFTVGLEARSSGGSAPEKLGTVLVSGRKVMLYKREETVSLPPPGTGGQSTYTEEEFLVLPAGARFFVLSYRYEDSVPDASYDGQKAWRDFLKAFRLKKDLK